MNDNTFAGDVCIDDRAGERLADMLPGAFRGSRVGKPAFPGSPYAKFNLRRNPFGELTRDERAELAVVDVEPWKELLTRSNTALQFLGPCGHGKTTHLLAIQGWLTTEGRFPRAAYVYLPEDGPQPAIPAQRPLLIDEAQRLSYWARRRVFKRGGPLVLGSHEDLSRTLRRWKMEVVTVEVAADPSPERLSSILNRRIEASRSGSGAIPRLGPEHVAALQRMYGADIRCIERHLYDQFQEAVEKDLPWPPVS